LHGVGGLAVVLLGEPAHGFEFIDGWISYSMALFGMTLYGSAGRAREHLFDAENFTLHASPQSHPQHNGFI